MSNPTEIQLDPSRLTALASIARKARATMVGLNDKTHDARDRKADLRRRLDLARQAAASAHSVRPLIGSDGTAKGQMPADVVADLERQIAEHAADVTVLEVEQGEAAEAAASARANLRAAIAYAKSVGLPVPAGVEEVQQ